MKFSSKKKKKNGFVFGQQLYRDSRYFVNVYRIRVYME